MSDNITLDLVDECHVCGQPCGVEERCPFDMEMNTHMEPRPCCRDCRNDCAHST